MAQSSTTAVAPGLVTLSSVKTTVLAAVNSGRIGDPVNVRLHWQIEESTTDLTGAAIVAAGLADAVLSLANPGWRVRTRVDGRLLHILGRDDRGRTTLISLCAGDTSTLAVTVYGNHGVVRLEDSMVGELDMEEPANDTLAASLKQAIAAASV